MVIDRPTPGDWVVGVISQQPPRTGKHKKAYPVSLNGTGGAVTERGDAVK